MDPRRLAATPRVPLAGLRPCRVHVARSTFCLVAKLPSAIAFPAMMTHSDELESTRIHNLRQLLGKQNTRLPMLRCQSTGLLLSPEDRRLHPGQQ
ncbi:hypothetical protein K474DRAFT_1095180 [Panus rudis PR-1116 ss-1]|nr:hypothetical protein K474DRAFT_1095180 [Panus rudis PR-1116 ss-1]